MNVTQSRSFHLISLGCARNRVDAEVVLGRLLGNGWQHSSDPATTDAIIINTCGFIEAAKEESIDIIIESAEHKKNNPQLKLVVAGCLTQRYKHQLVKGLPEVDLFVGTDQFSKIPQLLDNLPKAEHKVVAKRDNFIYDEQSPRVNTLSTYAAYVKIAEGCQHNCAFCIIPAIRGRLRSRSIKSVVAEVERLVSSGVVEINLIAQDLAAYGRDQGQDLLLPLLYELEKISQLKWVRLLYVYPENITSAFIDFFARSQKLVKYIDIPVQHASDKILSSMNRGVTQAQLRTTITSLRAKIPGIAIRTSVMVGFPAETAQDFEQLLSLVKDMRFEHLGCFVYSQEEGTVAARMPQQVDSKIAYERQQLIMECQQHISAQRLTQLVGTKTKVLLMAKKSSGDFVARLSTQAPEVDGQVHLAAKDVPLTAQLGQIVDVRIHKSDNYDLFAKVATS